MGRNECDPRQFCFAVCRGEVIGDVASVGARGDTGKPIIRLCRLPLLVTAMFNPRLAATWAARDCDCMMGNSA